MTTEIDIPDELMLQPEEYDLPEYITGSYRKQLERHKPEVKISKKQIQFFGEKGVPWTDIEKFYNVDRITLMRNYMDAYEKGQANINIALRSKQIELALSGNPTMLIWLGKQKLGQTEQGNPVVINQQINIQNKDKDISVDQINDMLLNDKG